AADSGAGSLLLPRPLHDDRLRRRRPGPWLASARGDRGPRGDHSDRLVDGVRVRGREPHVRALAAGARRGLTTARAPRAHLETGIVRVGIVWGVPSVSRISMSECRRRNASLLGPSSAAM